MFTFLLRWKEEKEKAERSNMILRSGNSRERAGLCVGYKQFGSVLIHLYSV